MTKDRSGIQFEDFKGLADDLFNDNEDAELDERYRKEDVIDVKRSAYEKAPDSFSLLSNELNDERCHIRTPEQQAEWVKKKSNNQKALGRIILHFSSVRERLIDECSGKQKMLLGELVARRVEDKKTGAIRDEVGINYSSSLRQIVKGLLEDFERGDSSYSLEELSELIVGDYNLSYHHFIKPETERLTKAITSLMKERIDLAPPGDLFSSTVQKPESILLFEDSEKIDYGYASTSLLRQMRILSASIQGYKERLVTTNIRSCLNVSMQFFHAYAGTKSTSFGVLDLVSEAAEGLLHAADMFVYGVSVKFTTYAEYWIRLRVGRYIKNNNPIRLPIHVTEVVSQILRCFREKNKELDLTLDSRGLNSIPLNKQEVESILGKSIPDATWQVALNRQKGVIPYVRCSVNPGQDDDELSFDIVTEGTAQVDSVDESVIEEADDIISLAKKLTEKPWQIKYNARISEQQYSYLICKYKKDMSFSDIAKSHEVEVRDVRRSLNEAISVLQRLLV